MNDIGEKTNKSFLSLEAKSFLIRFNHSTPNSILNEIPKRYPTRLYERLRDKPLSQLSDSEVHYILEQLLGGDRDE